MKRQSGFTLVEIAIVLVIVGLLLAGIIQGSALIDSGTAKNMANELKTVPVYVYQYQDKFRALPGDDIAATAHLGTTPPVTNGDGNGRIGGKWDATAGESFNFWQHVRLAGLTSGPTTIPGSADLAAFAPRNVAGGRIGVSSEVPIKDMTGSHFVCSRGILGKYVKQIDTTLDDGNTATGSVRAAEAPGGGSTSAPDAEASVDDAKTYDVCMGF